MKITKRGEDEMTSELFVEVRVIYIVCPNEEVL